MGQRTLGTSREQPLPGDVAICLFSGAGTRTLRAFAATASGYADLAEIEPAVRAALPSRVCVFGGTRSYGDEVPALQTAEMFDPEVGDWTPLPSMPSRRLGPDPVVVGGRAYLCGGDCSRAEGTSAVDCFDLREAAWEVAEPLAEARCGHLVVEVAGMIYACGGMGKQGQLLRSVERFDPKSGRWQRAPDMGGPRFCPGGDAIGAELYLCGGMGHWCSGPSSGDSPAHLRTAERLVPGSSVWEELTPMMAERESPGIAQLGGYLVVCSGGLGEAVLRTAERFDPGRKVWEQLPSMAHGRLAPAVGVVGERLVLCGGLGEQGQSLSSVEAFDSRSHAWESLQSMHVARADASLVVAGHSIYICGGVGIHQRVRAMLDEDDAEEELQVPLAEVERYNLRTGTWETLPPMSEERYGAAAVAL